MRLVVEGLAVDLQALEPAAEMQIFRLAGAVGVEAHHAENIPARHTAVVLVAGVALDAAVIVFVMPRWNLGEDSDKLMEDSLEAGAEDSGAPQAAKINGM